MQKECESMKKFFWFLLIAASACVPGTRTGGFQDHQAVNYIVELPEQWRKVNSGRHFMMTKDGPFNQYILIQQRHLEEPFSHTRRTFNKGMLPQEAAEVVLDEIASDRSVLNFHVIENTPAKLSRYDGFRIIFTYKTKKGLGFKTIYHGILKGDWYYSIRYNVSENHDSLKDMETFEKVLNSFRIEGA